MEQVESDERRPQNGPEAQLVQNPNYFVENFRWLTSIFQAGDQVTLFDYESRTRKHNPNSIFNKNDREKIEHNKLLTLFSISIIYY